MRDTDTAAILRGIEERGNPWSWFAGDWPLFNHFYRPVSTLTFEWDLARAGRVDAAFGTTNSLLVVAAVWCLFWLAKELTGRGWVAGIAALVFGLWHTYLRLGGVADVFFTLAVLSVLGLLRGGGVDRWAAVGSAFSLWWLAATWFMPTYDIGFRLLGWIPGRTAGTMTVFGLIALAAYARFERLMAARRPLPPDPERPPVTQSTSGAPEWCWKQASVWLGLSLLGLLGALGSYEQAVTLPALFVGVAVWFWLVEHRRPHWWVPAASWLVLVGYALLRRAVLPAHTSGYQEQQFRSGPGVANSLFEYLFPPYNGFRALRATLEAGLEVLVLPQTWGLLGGVFALTLAVWAIARVRERWSVAFAWLAAFVAFLPMAWLKHFDHYHQWPLAFRAIGFALVLGLAARLTVEAFAPLPVRAPRRTTPAPGSLS